MLAAEHVHSSATTGEVNHLLPCNLSWRYTHTLALNAVVGTEEQMARVVKSGVESLLDKANLQCQLLKASQRAFGLVEVVYLVDYCLTHPLVGLVNIELCHCLNS